MYGYFATLSMTKKAFSMARFKDLRFVVLAVENLGVKLKFWLFGLSCKAYVLRTRRLESVFVFCLVMINKNTL